MHRPKLTAALLLLAGGLAVSACSATAAPSTSAGSTSDGATTATSDPVEPTLPTPTLPPELPRGGREIFPTYRLVGFSGGPDDPQYVLGRLTGDLDKRCKEIQKVGKDYAYGREVMPVFELIAVVVQGSPGEDGKWRFRRPKSDIREYLDAARRCNGLLLLNIQPGQSEFLPEMKHYEEFLKEPDVGVALDPEWAMDPGERPGTVLGSSDGVELDQAAAYLSQIVQENDLPEKVMVFHQFHVGTVSKLGKLKPHEGVTIIRSIDGLGGPESKKKEYKVLARHLPPWIHPGFKLFYKEDVEPPWGSRLMTPREVMKQHPQPEYILYE